MGDLLAVSVFHVEKPFFDPSNRIFVRKAVCNHDFGWGACGVCALEVV